MPYAFDGTKVPYRLDPLPCGGVPEWDDGSGYSYRCDRCGAVVGSMGMPRMCADMLEEERQGKEVWRILNN